MNDNLIMEMYKKYEPFFGNWYLKRFIGEGGFAKVFEIVRNDFGKEYVSALKIITISKTKSEINTLRSEGMTDEDIRGYLRGIVEDTVREIQLMYELKGNGNVVGYEDHAVMEHEDGMGWDILIKMEYLTSLSSYIRHNKGRLAKRDVIKLGIDICKALETCQKYSIIHRDIKADNIFIAKSGDFKLGDFGIARVIERKDQTLSKKGTSAYMAPEVYKGQTYTSAVDIYSLGMVLYRLLNNNRGPFLPEYPKPMSLDDRDHALMMRMSGEKFPKPCQVGKSRLTEIVLKACAYRPEERYSSPGFMRQELEAILIDQDEVTTEEMIMIYEEGRSDTASSHGSTPVVPQREEPTAATEMLRNEAMELLREDDATEALRQESVSEDGATEVLRSDATEVLREEATEVLRPDDATEVLRPQAAWPESAQQADTSGVSTGAASQSAAPGAPALTDQQEVKVLCKKCGSIFPQGAKTCTSCGASQEEKAEAPRRKKSVRGKHREKRKNKKALVIGGVCAAVFAIALIIGVRVVFIRSLQGKIITITFLDTLDDKPFNAWFAPEFGKGRVMTWAVKRSDGNRYDLYIGAEGGVIANKSCKDLFYGYDKVKQIHFNGNFDTSNVKDMSDMFRGCSSLTSVDVSSFDTSNVTNMRGMFSGCLTLTSVDVSGFDTSQVTDMWRMFDSCRKLTSVDASSFDTSQVTDMSHMFGSCYDLTSVDVSGFDTSNVTDMSGMFEYCKKLTSVDVSGFDTSQVTKVQGMFSGCYSLTGVDVSNFAPELVEKMGLTSENMEPSQNSKPSAQEVPKPWSDNILMPGVLFGEASLTSAVFESEITREEIRTVTFLDSLDNMPGDAWDVSADGSGRVMAWVMPRENGYGYDLYIGGEGGVAANKDCNYLFGSYTNVQQIQINGNFHTENTTEMVGMFYGCGSLKSVDVSDFDTSNVTSMFRMFDGCRSLTSVDVSGFDTSNVTSMVMMFYQCSSLTSVDVSGFDTSQVTNMSYMFSRCSSLTSVDVSNFSSKQVEDMDIPSSVRPGSTAPVQSSLPSGTGSGGSGTPKPSESPKPTQSPTPAQSPKPAESAPGGSGSPAPSGPPPGGSDGQRPDRPPQS